MAKLDGYFYKGIARERFGIGLFVDTFEGLGVCLEFMWFYVGFTMWRV